jgi:hypothetical protein
MTAYSLSAKTLHFAYLGTMQSFNLVLRQVQKIRIVIRVQLFAATADQPTLHPK